MSNFCNNDQTLLLDLERQIPLSAHSKDVVIDDAHRKSSSAVIKVVYPS